MAKCDALQGKICLYVYITIITNNEISLVTSESNEIDFHMSSFF